MGFFLSTFGRLKSAWRAFVAPNQNAPYGAWITEFSRRDNRMARYKLHWKYYENTVYETVLNSLGADYMTANNLYRYTKGISNPVSRLVAFWTQNLLQAGPTLVDGLSPAVYPAWSKLLRDSNYDQTRTILAMYGVLMGDAPIKVVEDLDRRLMRLEFLNPATVVELSTRAGFVTSYVIEENIIYEGEEILYREECERGNDKEVIFRTYRNRSPFGFYGMPAEFVKNYGFVPMVWIQHLNVNLPFGWGELQGKTVKIDALNDLLSKIVDQIRKSVDPVWFAAGLEKPAVASSSGTIAMQGQAATTSLPMPGRNENRIIYGGVNSTGVKFDPIVAPLDLAAALETVKALQTEIEMDFPELTLDAQRMAGTTSARALEIVRQPIKQRVTDRRAGYTAGLIQAAQMAFTIGGQAGYKDYTFSDGDYEAGKMDLELIDPGVFASSPYDAAELKLAESVADSAFWAAASAAGQQGIALDSYLDYAGVSEEKAEKLTGSQEPAGQFDSSQ